MTDNKQVTITAGEWIKGGVSAAVLLVLAAACMSTSGTTSSTSSSDSCTKEAWVCAAEKHEISMRWDCEDAIKGGLKDPRSYQANDVKYWPSMDSAPALVMVKINFTAKNGFGGAARQNAVCHADKNGNVLNYKFL